MLRGRASGLHCMIALLVCCSKGPCDGCSLGLWCPQVSDGGEHAHGLTAHDTLIARGVLWQEGGEGEGGGGAGCAVCQQETLHCTYWHVKVEHCIAQVIMSKVSP